MIIGIMLSVPTPEPYNSMTVYSISVPVLFIWLFTIIGGLVLIKIEEIEEQKKDN